MAIRPTTRKRTARFSSKGVKLGGDSSLNLREINLPALGTRLRLGEFQKRQKIFERLAILARITVGELNSRLEPKFNRWQPMACADRYDIWQWQAFARQSTWQAELLSRKLGISRRQLQRCTRKLFGCSPQDWLNRQRLALAVELLQEQRLVKEVWARLGYKQASHFSRAFKMQHGLSPTAFLRWNKKQITICGTFRQRREASVLEEGQNVRQG